MRAKRLFTLRTSIIGARSETGLPEISNHKHWRTDYDRLYNLQNRERKSESRRSYPAASSRTEFHRFYNLQNGDNDFRNRSGSRLRYHRCYNFQNKEKTGEFYLRNVHSRKDYLRNYYLQHLARPNRPVNSEYNRQYNLQNKEKTAEYRSRDVARKANRRLQSRGQREYSRFYYGSQRFNLSWKNPDLVRNYFDAIAGSLNISNFADWYRISKIQLDQFRGMPLMSKFGCLGTALYFAYPEISWDMSRFRSRGKKRSVQRWLKIAITKILPGLDVLEDYQHPDLFWDDSCRNMELDLWIPLHCIGIEYQGEQHFFNVDVYGPSSAASSYRERDLLKESLCQSRGIGLITIPYWWDLSLESLSATLYRERPDVFPMNNAPPIPRERPLSFLSNHESHVNVHPMLVASE